VFARVFVVLAALWVAVEIAIAATKWGPSLPDLAAALAGRLAGFVGRVARFARRLIQRLFGEK
jgi:hypothetical protein